MRVMQSSGMLKDHLLLDGIDEVDNFIFLDQEVNMRQNPAGECWSKGCQVVYLYYHRLPQSVEPRELYPTFY